jgi:hypothetical protein
VRVVVGASLRDVIQLTLKRASASRPSGEWNDDYDVRGAHFRRSVPLYSPPRGHFMRNTTSIHPVIIGGLILFIILQAALQVLATGCVLLVGKAAPSDAREFALTYGIRS